MRERKATALQASLESRHQLLVHVRGAPKVASLYNRNREGSKGAPAEPVTQRAWLGSGTMEPRTRDCAWMVVAPSPKLPRDRLRGRSRRSLRAFLLRPLTSREAGGSPRNPSKSGLTGAQPPRARRLGRMSSSSRPGGTALGSCRGIKRSVLPIEASKEAALRGRRSR